MNHYTKDGLDSVHNRNWFLLQFKLNDIQEILEILVLERERGKDSTNLIPHLPIKPVDVHQNDHFGVIMLDKGIQPWSCVAALTRKNIYLYYHNPPLSK